jgi:hypothetical protein
LRSIGLVPIEWQEALVATGKASPYVGEVVDAAVAAAQAVVILFTPDELVALRPEYANGDEDPEVRPACQARPNVIFEAGLAIGRDPVGCPALANGQRGPPVVSSEAHIHSRASSLVAAG